MKALDRKVWRELRLLWSQAATIALVVASGIGGFVASLSAVDSLAAARDSFYASGRFADVFASAKRAPEPAAALLRELAGVQDLQTTVEGFARLTLAGDRDPAVGQLIGLDARQPQRLNLMRLRAGRMPQAGKLAGGELEAAVSEGFAQARKLKPGDAVIALVNGKRRTLRITGTALSPEYIFSGMFGMPDLRAFGVFWVDKDELAAAMDMVGAFNRVAIKLAPHASEHAVIDAVTRQLEPLGGAPAHGRQEQISHMMLDNEIQEQQVIGTVLPAIFLAVAGFLLHVVTARLVATQREQVATLKALGYGNRALAWHYLKLMSPMVMAGYALGLAAGWWLGGALTALYAEFFRFPAFGHFVSTSLAWIGFVVVVAMGALGTLTAVSATVRLPPAAAMQPPAPGRYRRALVERLPRLRLGNASRMILRNMERRPLRAAVTIGGVAVAVAIVIMGNFFRDAIDAIVQTQFRTAMRGDLIVWSTEPVDAAASRELARLPGVIRVEPGRRVAVRFLNGPYSEMGSIDARPPGTQLQRVIDVDGRQASAGTHGLLMTDRLADKLHLRPGDSVTVEVREGKRQLLRVALERTVRDMMGMNAYMESGALNRMLGDGDVASAFSIAIEPGHVEDVLAATQAMPRVGGTFAKATMLRNMREISTRNVLIMSAVLTTFAAVIAVGVVYNNARIALAERTWELASLRVLGFTRAEVSLLLLGELALGIAAALPLGMLLGFALVHSVVGLIRSDQFLFPVVIRAPTYAWAAIAVVAAGVASAMVVRRRIDRLDMVAALKTRE